MKTIRRISEKVATPENFIQGFVNYAEGKPNRTDIREYEANLAANIKTQVKAFITGTWEVPDYEEREIVEDLPSDFKIQFPSELFHAVDDSFGLEVKVFCTVEALRGHSKPFL